MAEFQFHIAAAGDFQCIVQGLGIIRENGFHFLPALEVIGIVIETHPVRIEVVGPRLDAQQHILAGRILPMHIMQIVRRHQLHMMLPGQVMEFCRHSPFFRQVMVLDLQIIMVGPENIQILQHDFFRRLQLSPHDVTGHFTGYAGAQADESLMILPEHVLVDPRLVIKTVHLTDGNEFHQVGIPCHVLRQQDQMVQFVPGIEIFRPQGTGRDVDLAADDRFDPVVFAGTVELDDTVHHPVIRDGESRHPLLPGKADEFRDAARPVEEAVLRMRM